MKQPLRTDDEWEKYDNQVAGIALLLVFAGLGICWLIYFLIT
jgi:hypothetical protein